MQAIRRIDYKVDRSNLEEAFWGKRARDLSRSDVLGNLSSFLDAMSGKNSD